MDVKNLSIIPLAAMQEFGGSAKTNIVGERKLGTAISETNVPIATAGRLCERDWLCKLFNLIQILQKDGFIHSCPFVIYKNNRSDYRA